MITRLIFYFEMKHLCRHSASAIVRHQRNKKNSQVTMIQ